MCLRLLLLLAAVFLIVACGGGGSDGGGNVGGGTSTGGGSTTLMLEANFNSIQAKLFDTTCAVSGCHEGSGAPHGLQLSAGDSYGLLVGVPSGEVPGLNRIEPFDPDNSYLIQKLEGTAAVGARMPRGGAALAQADIDAIRLWISNGALQTSGGFDDTKAGGFRVQASAPANGAIIHERLTRIVLVFTRPLDMNTLFPEAFAIIGSGGDGSFAEGNEIRFQADRIRVPRYNEHTVILELTSFELKPDNYHLLINAKSDLSVQDFGANQLAEDFLSAFILE